MENAKTGTQEGWLHGGWKEDTVREWQLVNKEAKDSGEQAHVVRIFGIVVEKTTNSQKATHIESSRDVRLLVATTYVTNMAITHYSRT